MRTLHRWLILPAIVALVGAILIYLDVVTFQTGWPLHPIAFGVGIVASLLLLVAIVLEARLTVRSWEMPEPEEPPQADYVISPREMDDAVESVQEAEQFSRRATDRILIDIDIEDGYDDE